jgi:hypothetical protein
MALALYIGAASVYGGRGVAVSLAGLAASNVVSYCIEREKSLEQRIE